MCARCHKRVATVFVTKVENGERKTEGLCVKCAQELGMPTDQLMGNVIGKLGITPEQLESMEGEISGLLQNMGLPSDNDDNEDGGAPAIDFPKLFRESGLFGNLQPQSDAPSDGGEEKKSDTKKKGEKPILTSFNVFMLTKNNHYDSSKAREELGYTTRPYRETIYDMVEWLLAEGFIKKEAAE